VIPLPLIRLLYDNLCRTARGYYPENYHYAKLTRKISCCNPEGDTTGLRHWFHLIREIRQSFAEFVEDLKHVILCLKTISLTFTVNFRGKESGFGKLSQAALVRVAHEGLIGLNF
jgi:hypothetical protein